jgi:hypothetical protein
LIKAQQRANVDVPAGMTELLDLEANKNGSDPAIGLKGGLASGLETSAGVTAQANPIGAVNA